ncbi:IPExxxVDY family protein [Hymenobacter sp. HMF4947]|uniref:IPExxxVDY family protein n=1 Tax=Hymenobacter ginkgonis TaxID=2682976 RepID=A0A7K1TJB5_9BACT|nr:IPExxxVDY family protein [Hymenobacter ginkgonis]MVN78453.1 IPExxxVDY family protein [Hymenobacter ginkgonis]
MKTLTLDAEYDCDFALFGLVSNSHDYTLAWSLNGGLRLRLVRQPDFVLHLVQQGPLAFSYYLHGTEAITLRLLRNRAILPSVLPKPFLAPDIREYDYLLQVYGGSDELAGIELLDRLTALPAVQYASELDPQELKYKENLIF